MLLPVLLLFLAVFAGAVVAYGTHPVWARYPHGIELILLSRQHQWPIAAFAMLMCLAVIALVASGKWRVWWLIGLGPILALFGHRFCTDPLRAFCVLDGPMLVESRQATFLADDDYVVGLTFNGSAYAYPYQALYPCPVVFQADREKRMMLVWSAFANRAVAYTITRELRSRDVEIVSMPANAMLLYNTRLGEFINGITGLTARGEKPTGLVSPLPVEKMTWARWRAAHPATRVMAPQAAVANPAAFKAALRPVFAQPRLQGSTPGDVRIAMLPTTRPVAVLSDGITRQPLNFTAGQTPVLVFRDPQTGRIRAFERRVDDLVPRFKLNTSTRRKQVYLIDQDSNSGWLPDGRAIDGQFGREKRRLTPIPVDEDLYWSVMKTWLPELELVNPSQVK